MAIEVSATIVAIKEFGVWLLKRFISFVVTLVIFASQAHSQSFSCSFGTQPACLDYGDKVCSSMGKCVSSDAVCFDSFTCGFDGFVCKSSLNEVIEEYDELVERYNTLVTKYEDLRFDYNQLVSSKNELNDKFSDLLEEFEQQIEQNQYLISCISGSSSISEAQNCY